MATTNRPFFSVIIPCYNSGTVLKNLMESISTQKDADLIEVIIADDCSTVPYPDIINQYTDKLKIKFIQTEYNFGPGNTRQKGLEIAEGKWITFADHDDFYLPDAFRTIRNRIKRNKEKYMVVSNFIEYSIKTDKILRKMVRTDNWMHGKFYNLDNFIKPFHLHFKKDLLTHEDIYFSTMVSCAMSKLKRHPLYIDDYTYVWVANPESISRRLYDGNQGFLEKFLDDYITSTGSVYLDLYEKNELEPEYAVPGALSALLYVYFYIQGFKFHNPKTYDRDNIIKASKYLVRMKELFQITNQDIMKIIWANPELYKNIREGSYVGIGNFVETEDISTFLDILHHDIIRKSINDDIYNK